MAGSLRTRTLLFLLALVVLFLPFRSALTRLTGVSWNDERFAYVVLAPVASLLLLLVRRKAVFAVLGYSPALGLPLILTGILLSVVGNGSIPGLHSSASMEISISGMIFIAVGIFAWIFGLVAFRNAIYPLCLLLLTIPLPGMWLDGIVLVLQDSSAFLSGVLFRLLGIPAFRDGHLISLPGFDIAIAEQCSGIRSSTVLVLASAAVAWVCVRSPVKRVIPIIVTVPLVILKNAVRIVTISSVALYINRAFLFGRLHRYGGLCFSLLDVMVLMPLFIFLHRSESFKRGPDTVSRRQSAR